MLLGHLRKPATTQLCTQWAARSTSTKLSPVALRQQFSALASPKQKSTDPLVSLMQQLELFQDWKPTNAVHKERIDISKNNLFSEKCIDYNKVSVPNMWKRDILFPLRTSLEPQRKPNDMTPMPENNIVKEFVVMNRNRRKPKRANKGKRPVSRHRRSSKIDLYNRKHERK
mmetsp:Transcript_32457/g.47363  ORF Transcript_32457/g.47363 Transcript_32457/m.47363 type:complete len:171 (+) Transcript_32457:211-723(+)